MIFRRLQTRILALFALIVFVLATRKLNQKLV